MNILLIFSIIFFCLDIHNEPNNVNSLLFGFFSGLLSSAFLSFLIEKINCRDKNNNVEIYINNYIKGIVLNTNCLLSDICRNSCEYNEELKKQSKQWYEWCDGLIENCSNGVNTIIIFKTKYETLLNAKKLFLYIKSITNDIKFILGEKIIKCGEIKELTDLEFQFNKIDIDSESIVALGYMKADLMNLLNKLNAFGFETKKYKIYETSIINKRYI